MLNLWRQFMEVIVPFIFFRHYTGRILVPVKTGKTLITGGHKFLTTSYTQKNGKRDVHRY